MKKVLDKIEDRHWVFIIGIIGMIVSSIWSPETAGEIGTLLVFMGIGIVISGR